MTRKRTTAPKLTADMPERLTPAEVELSIGALRSAIEAHERRLRAAEERLRSVEQLHLDPLAALTSRPSPLARLRRWWRGNDE